MSCPKGELPSEDTRDFSKTFSILASNHSHSRTRSPVSPPPPLSILPPPVLGSVASCPPDRPSSSAGSDPLSSLGFFPVTSGSSASLPREKPRHSGAADKGGVGRV